MTIHKLENYLRTYRRKSGLTQREVAFLLGCKNGAQISRYEKRRRLPPLRTALACESVFGVPLSRLFAGISDVVGRETQKRVQELKSKLQAENTKDGKALMTAHKLAWLAQRAAT
jgi:transcriptional regulator with XRE-family HTH domain